MRYNFIGFIPLYAAQSEYEVYFMPPKLKRVCIIIKYDVPGIATGTKKFTYGNGTQQINVR